MAQVEIIDAKGERDLDLYRQIRSKTNNIIYKNILTLNKEGKEADVNPSCINELNCSQVQAAQAENDWTNTAEKECDSSDIWQMYMQYAQNALENLSNCAHEVQPATDTNECAVCAEENNSAETDQCSEIQIPSAAINVPDLKCLTEQLDRMEQMLREIYLCNQELCKSLLNYCTAYGNE